MREVFVSPTPLRGPSGLDYSKITPVASNGLGGLLRDHIANGRLFATVGWHGGLTHVSYIGAQHLSAFNLFEVGLESAWTKLFRMRVRIGEDWQYPAFDNSQLYPFGIASNASMEGVDLRHELLLLPDAIVQRCTVQGGARSAAIAAGMLHHERICQKPLPERTWAKFKFESAANALVGSVVDQNPATYNGDGDSLSQRGLGLTVKDAPSAETWIGISCDTPMTVHTSFNDFKLYLSGREMKGGSTAFFVVFATSRRALLQRISELASSVNQECDALVEGYERRLRERPRISVGNELLDSAFGQYPEYIEVLKIPDKPGAVRAGIERSFIWGWDGMTPLTSSPLANEAEYSVSILRFFQEMWNPVIGIPMLMTTSFDAKLRAPFPAQAQYIAGLYHYVATTGDLAAAREMMPTCKRILDRCRERKIGDTALVRGHALWPDFPECMGEDGHDIAAINNSILYQGLRCMEYLARVQEDQPLADECRDWAAKLRESFIQYLYDEQKGYFITSCSAKDLSPRKHYGSQVIFWLTPFARELVSHAPGRIASFMNEHLRSAKCLLSLPRWDTSWMADGNQLGGSYPMADHFYVNMNKLVGEASALESWMNDVEWFWQFHTAPEAFTPDVVNEHQFGPDNHGGKQAQACSTWYTCAYTGIAGLDFDHEGLTITPWGEVPVDIGGLRLRGTIVDLKISGSGTQIQSLKLNGETVSRGSRKLGWGEFGGRNKNTLEVVRGSERPGHPVVVRADGLRIAQHSTSPGRLLAVVEGDMTGEVVIQTEPESRVLVDGRPVHAHREPATGTVSIPYSGAAPQRIEVLER